MADAGTTPTSTGRRSRPSRARSFSTWACASCPTSPTALVAAGRPAAEPAAVVERGTLPDQRTVTGTLATIAERARAEEVRAPAITVVGPVAKLAEQLAWRRAAPAGRAHRGGHPRPRPGERPGRSGCASSGPAWCRPRRSVPGRWQGRRSTPPPTT